MSQRDKRQAEQLAEARQDENAFKQVLAQDFSELMKTNQSPADRSEMSARKDFKERLRNKNSSFILKIKHDKQILNFFRP